MALGSIIALMLLATCALPYQGAPETRVVAGPLVDSGRTETGHSAAQHHREDEIVARIHSLEDQVEALKKKVRKHR